MHCKKINIGWVEIGNGVYGGQIYNEMAREHLSDFCSVKTITIQNRILPGFIGNIENAIRILALSGEKDFWIREIPSLWAIGLDRTKGKNIAMIHHDDFSGYSPWKRFILQALWYRGYKNLSRCERIITVSRFWRERYLSCGLKNVRTVYNAFKISRYDDITCDEANSFARENKLDDKPILYLGNCQKAKGVVDVYEALKDLDVHLLCSGKKSVNIPVKSLLLSHLEYLKLLKASSIVIAMSKFDEGWCRVAHEGMLMKRPVVGSGRGGMKELLEGGSQIICEDFKLLKRQVQELLESKNKTDELGEKGRKFAEKFTVERFVEEWREALN